MQLLFSLIILLIFSSPSFASTNWFVRDGGGTKTQCTGTTNAVYPGSGTSQPCAFNHPRWVLGWDYDNPQSGVISGGDTLYIDGDSDIHTGQQAQYLIGYDDTGAGTTPDCNVAYPWDCALFNIPTGTISNPTSVIGTGTHKPQLWGNERVWQVLDAENNYITLQWLELTDHEACAYNNSANLCNYGGSYPYGAWAEDGLEVAGVGLNMTDVYIHGLGRLGMNVNTSTTSWGNATFTRVYVIGNGFGGFTTGTAASITGTLTFNQPIIEWNGCVEAYPLTGAGVDNPSNYSNCFGQQNNGYGDGLAFGNDTTGNAGNWTLIGPGSISFNTQDGLDTLHGNGNGTIKIDKMRFEGNGGDQVKANATNFSLTNSIIFGDCGWWYLAPQSAPGAMPPGDSCRALGDVILFNVTNSSTANIFNNTIFSNGNITLESIDENNTGCNGSTVINVANNIVQGGYAWINDTTWNGAGDNGLTTYIYNSGNNGDGAGTCGSLTWNENYNIVRNTKNNNQGCVGANDKCGTAPGFIGTVPIGTAGGGVSTYYQGQAGVTLVPISVSSQARNTGENGLTYWNTPTDYYNVTRSSPFSMGAEEYQSCAVVPYGCQFNSDCCGGNCSNNACSGSCSINGSSCTTGSTCCSALCQSSLCVACLSNGGTCINGSTCCSGICNAGICSASSCTANGGSCSIGSTCCSGLCQSSFCVSCETIGGNCSTGSDCCSGICCSGLCSLSCGGSTGIITQVTGTVSTSGKVGF